MNDIEALLELLNAGGYPPANTPWRELTNNYDLSIIQDLFCEIPQHETRQYVASQIRYSYTRDTHVDHHRTTTRNWYLTDPDGIRTVAPTPSVMSQYILSCLQYADQVFSIQQQQIETGHPITLDKKVQAVVLILLLQALGISRNSDSPKSVPMIRICRFISLLTGHSIESLRNDLKGFGISLSAYHSEQINYINQLFKELHLDLKIEKNKVY